MIGFVAMVLASANVVGGFVVTDRMLEMFKKRELPGETRRLMGTTGVNLLYLVTIVCFAGVASCRRLRPRGAATRSARSAWGSRSLRRC